MGEIEYSWDSIKEMLDEIGLSPDDQAITYNTWDLPRIQRHAAQTIFCMKRPDTLLRNPVGWFKASIKANWGPPPGFDAEQKIMHFRVDESTWAEMQKSYPCPICGSYQHPEKDCPRKLKGATQT